MNLETPHISKASTSSSGIKVSKYKSLKCVYTNADCLTNKLTALEECIELNKPDIIAVTELKPKNSTFPLSSSTFNMDNYQFFHNIDSIGRGIGIYTHNSLRAIEVTLTSTCREYVCLQIKLCQSDYLKLICFYRSPSSTEEENEIFINDFPKIVGKEATHLLIVGDFNFRNINWEQGISLDSSTHVSSKFLETTQDMFLYQHVGNNTRYREGNAPSRVDFIFTNEEGMINNIEYQPPLWSEGAQSDHLVLVFDFKCYIEQEEPNQEKYNYKKANFTLLREKINKVNWDQILEDNIEEATKTFYNIYDKAVKECIPKIKCIQRKVGNKPIWMTKEGVKKVRKKYRAWQRYLCTKDGIDYQNYISLRNKSNSFLKKLCKNFERDLANNIKDNPKKFWKYVNSKSKTRTGIQSLSNQQGSLVEGDKEKADILNTFFTSVFTIDDNTLVPNIFPLPDHTTFKFREITIDEIKKKINKLKPNKSPGPDQCHPLVLKELVEAIAIPLHIIFNLSIKTGKVPLNWKSGNITPIFKKGSRLLPSNYRPVSLTSILCKLLESCIRDQILTFVKDNNIFSDDQHGFRPHRSCVTQLLIIMDEWTKILDEGNNIDCIYLDFAKAFDSVSHNRLLMKLTNIGFGDTPLQWVKSFLSDRRQRVCLPGAQSEWVPVTSGVPQGSVLGPILFLLFINDLPDAINTFVKIFADDTKIYNTVKNEEDVALLQQNIDNAVSWSKTWQLPFNDSKCKVLHIGKKNTEANYTIGEGEAKINLERVQEEKDLGVTFDDKLDFKTHINQSILKANRILGILKRNFCQLDQPSFTLLYKSMVRPHLEYGNTIWRPHKREDINRIEKIQRRATKQIKSISHLSYEERLSILRLPTLEYRRARGDMIQTYKILHKIDDLDPTLFFNLADNNRTRGHPLKLNKPRARLDIRKYSFSVRVINEWNSLPEEVVLAPSINCFKNRLDRFWNNRKFIY